jgi:hypothetical protein
LPRIPSSFQKQEPEFEHDPLRLDVVTQGIRPCRIRGGIMSAKIDIRGLTRFEIADDGTAVSLVAEDAAGRPVTLAFPVEMLSSLIMTLPRMVTSAVQRRNNDPSARVVYPLSDFGIELSTDLRTRILTLTTHDGFTVSFGLSDDQFRSIRCTDAPAAEMRGWLAN